MEDSVLQDRPGLFSRVAGLFARTEVYEEEVDLTPSKVPSPLQYKSSYRYTVTVRRQITAFEDAMAAANGLKSGDQQILNLAGTEPQLRQKIVDFMCGVNFAQEGTWEEIGEHIYMVVPASSHVEVVPATPRGSALKN